MSNKDSNLQSLGITKLAVTDPISLAPKEGSYTMQPVKKQVTNIYTGEQEVIDTYKPVMTEGSEKIYVFKPETDTPVKLQLFEGTKLIIQPSARLRFTERYLVGDLVLLKDVPYTLEYCNKPITELLTGIPDVAPLPLNMQQSFQYGSSLYPKHKYKTQRQLIDHIVKRNSLYSVLVSLQIIQPPEVLARTESEKKLNLKETLKLREEQFLRQKLEIEAQLKALEN